MAGRDLARHGDTICHAALAAIGLWFAIGGWRMAIIEDGVPGPGLVPLLLGLVMTGLAAWGAGAAAFGRHGPASDDGDTLSWEAGKALVLITAYVLAFEHVGFVACTFAFLAACLVWIWHEPWQRALIAAALATAGVWLVFVKLLGVGLPAGLLTGLLTGLPGL